MLALFHYKKCCNLINLFTYILCDLIVMSLVISGKKVDQDSWSSYKEHMLEVEESVYLASNVATWPTCKMTHKMHR